MTSFAFVIPFRPKAESADWEEDTRLLKRTVTSILRQTYPNLKVYVVYTDDPAIQVTDERVLYVQFPFGHQSWNEMRNRDNLFLRFKSEIKAERRWDKARKICYGSKLAKEAGCDYLMALDSDDLLSKNFLHYLSSRSHNSVCMGWYLDKGYLYRQNSNFLIRVPRYMCDLNGSTHVLHSTLVNIPDFNSLNWADYSQFTDHGWLRKRIKKDFNVMLEAVPTAMLVYVVHKSNMSQVYQKEYGFTLKAIVKRLLRGLWLTKRLREEFTIVPL